MNVVSGNFLEGVPDMGWVNTPVSCDVMWCHVTRVAPCSCDCYILKDIINNWADDMTTRILENVRKAMQPQSRLLIMERVLHTADYAEEKVSIGTRSHTHTHTAVCNLQQLLSHYHDNNPLPQFKALMDLTMMAFNPSQSRLRTEEEIRFLLEQTSFVDARTYNTRAGYSIVEAFKSETSWGCYEVPFWTLSKAIYLAPFCYNFNEITMYQNSCTQEH